MGPTTEDSNTVAASDVGRGSSLGETHENNKVAIAIGAVGVAAFIYAVTR